VSKDKDGTELNTDRPWNAEGHISNISNYKAYLTWFHENISGSISTFKEQMAKANQQAQAKGTSP